MKTEAEINQLAAEAMGIESWHEPKWSEPPDSECIVCEMPIAFDEHDYIYPDFCTDLNAAQRLLGVLPADDEDVWRLFEDVFEVYLHDNPNLNGGDLIELFRDTTARKLTFAILATLGKITLEEAKECLKNDN